MTYLKPENADFLFQVLGEWQLELPLPMPADVVVVHDILDQDVRELTAATVEDIVDGPIEYRLGFNAAGESIMGLPIERRTFKWWRFTIVPSVNRPERLFVEGWVERPMIEADFDPKVDRR